MTITIDINPKLFNVTYKPYLAAQQGTQIFYGGSSSGKSVFLSQRCLIDIMAGGHNYLVCREVGRSIRSSTYNEITKLIRDWKLHKLFRVNKTEMKITCTNGYQIIFTGLDDVEKIKSITPEKGVITDIWIEEATETNEDDINQLYLRLRGQSDNKKRVMLSFNPILQTHWIYKRYFQNWNDNIPAYADDDLLILKTTYKDNRFLSDDDVKRIESIADDYFYQVYALGNWGVLGDVIFHNWSIEDLSTYPAGKFRIGLDFGFASDPAAWLVTEKRNKDIFILSEGGERGLTNDVLADQLKKAFGSEYVRADSAEPKSIAELNQYGVNALPANKGKDSVVFGIQWLQQHTLHVDSKCVNIIRELQQYQWKKDKDGNSIKQPVDKNNHWIDALRYAYSDENFSTVSTSDNPFYG